MAKEKSIIPLFSVVIPLYNKADTIERTLRSVQAQNCRDFELIIVNDGSTDNSLEVVRTLSNEIPLQIIDKPNGGVSSARNAGASAAKGRFIALLDGDDVWFPDHLERLKKAIHKYPDVKFFGSGYQRISGERIYFTIPWGGYKICDVFSCFKWGQPIHTSTVVIDKDVWNVVGGFDERFSFYEDYEFFFRVGRVTKCCVVQKVSASYMTDAIEQATKKRWGVDRTTRPHFAYIDSLIESGSDSSEMIGFLSVHIGLLAFRMRAMRQYSELEELKKLFPNAFKKCWNLRLPVKAGRFMKILYLYFKCLFRFRHHLIHWRIRA
jgi:glycosyltransferase involved in cell wall biosynthesis